MADDGNGPAPAAPRKRADARRNEAALLGAAAAAFVESGVSVPVRDAIEKAIADSEAVHGGEIRFVVETAFGAFSATARRGEGDAAPRPTGRDRDLAVIPGSGELGEPDVFPARVREQGLGIVL